MASPEQFVKLAQSLPPRLIRLFKRYPPTALRQSPNPSPASRLEAGAVLPAQPSSSIKPAPPQEPTDRPNPFQPQRHPVTGRWHDPVYSLRRQADLVKLARQHGVEELLPFTVKGTAEKRRRREEQGLRIKGTGVGQKVKGHIWERTLKAKYVSNKALQSRRGEPGLQWPVNSTRQSALGPFSLTLQFVRQARETPTGYAEHAAVGANMEGGELMRVLAQLFRTPR